MTMIVTAIISSLILAGLARWANTRLCSEDKLPMQWWVTGEVTWFAPRPIALSVVPALAVLTFVVMIVLSFSTDPRSGQEAEVLPTMSSLGIMFLGIQVLHLWLIEKTVQRNSS